jgi:hypothetical protein
MRSKKRKTPAPSHWWYGIISLVGCVVLSGVVVGHNLPTSGSPQVPQLPTAPRVLLKAQFTPAYQPQTGEPRRRLKVALSASARRIRSPLLPRPVRG